MDIPPNLAKSIFLNALELSSDAERRAYLDAQCGQDTALRREVEELLEHHRQLGDFLESPAAGLGATADFPAVLEQPGHCIGRYQLLEAIGEGGLGVVYLAEQQEPVRRRVALKVLKPGMDTREVIARFESERQALAMMDHPNIARVLDAGATESGRPYFVMELVRGVRLTDYCDQHQLSIRQRLELFVEVCQGVQHAHQKGIIHRDLKPSNILVALCDGQPVPKIIDFGIAKAIASQLGDQTAVTSFGQMIGTPLYMSPEQAGLGDLDVDTRSDIYSLGVVLYELLTGCTPFEQERLRQASYEEIRRLIREEEPPRPSARITTLGAAATTAASLRNCDPGTLSRLLSHELDWVVMKCLEKDRNRRYETANALARDLQRYLADEPVQACPPSTGYRLRKFARRNRAALATATLVGMSLLLGLIVSTWQAVRATEAEQVAEMRLAAETEAREAAELAWAAEARQRQAAEKARRTEEALRREAERQRQRAEANFALARLAAEKFLDKVTEDQLLQAPGLQPLRRELLALALNFYQQFVKERSDDPSLQVQLADAHLRIGKIYRELGRFAECKSAFQQAMILYEKLRQEGQQTVEVLRGLADVNFNFFQYEKAIELCNQALAIKPGDLESKRILGSAYDALAVNTDSARNTAQALEYHRKALALREELVRKAPDNSAYLVELTATINNLGTMLEQQGLLAEALAMYQRAAAINEKALSRALHVPLYGRQAATALSNIARIHKRLGRHEEALQAFQRVVQVRRKLAVDNPAMPVLRSELFRAYRDLANQQRSMGKEQDALRSLRQGQELLENIPYHTAEERYILAAVYATLAETPKDAEAQTEGIPESERAQYAAQALALLKKAIVAGFKDVNLLQYDPALASIRNHEEFQQLLRILADASEGERQASEAPDDQSKLAALQKQADVQRKLLEWEPISLSHQLGFAATQHAVGLLQIRLGQYAKAEKSLADSLEIRQHLYKLNPRSALLGREYLATQVAFGQLEFRRGRFAEGHKLFQEILQTADKLAAQHPLDNVLHQQLAAMERSICDLYARAALEDKRTLDGVLDGLRQFLRPTARIDPAWLKWVSCWLPATLRNDKELPGIVFVTDLPWVRSTCGWGPTTATRDAYPWGGILSIAGLPYQKGIWTHAFNKATPADVVLDVSGKNFTTFKTHLAMFDTGSVQFQILVDSKVRYQSPLMNYGPIEVASVEVTGAKEVILRLLNGDDGYECDSAGWGYPRFVVAGAEDPLEAPPQQLHSATEADAALLLAEVHARLGHKDLALRWYQRAVAWIDQHTAEAEKLGPYRAQAAKTLGNTESPSTAKDDPEKPKPNP